MDTLECIRTRRSIRKYKDKPVEWEKVSNILDAGRMAPSAGNVQNWKFIIIRDEAARKKVSDACLQQDWMMQAPIHIAVCALPEKIKRYYGVRGERLYTPQNCAAAVENMLLAAHTQGLGSCWVGAFDEDMMRRALGLPEDVIIHAIVTIGYANESPQCPPRNAFFAIFYLEQWGIRKNVGPSGYGWWSSRTEKYAKSMAKNVEKFGDKLNKKVKEALKR